MGKEIKVTKSKRSQITIFVIVAIIIIVGVVAFFLLRDKINFRSSNVPAELNPLIDNIQNCIENTLEDGAKLVGLQGGYIIPPEDSLETNFSYIAWGYYLGSNTLASKAKIESEIAKYIELTLPFCFDASAFPEYKISTEAVKAETKINTNYISTLVSFPFTVSKGETSWNIDKKYSAEYKVKLSSIYSAAQSIISKEMQDTNTLDFTYLNSFDYDISILNEGNEVIVYSITDYNLNEAGSYTFRFANKLR